MPDWRMWLRAAGVKDIDPSHGFAYSDSAMLVQAAVEGQGVALARLSLAELDLAPAEALYIGDIYSLDVVGANRAGLDCVHLDPADLYQGWPGLRLPDISHLPAWLATYTAGPDKLTL